MTHNDFQVKWTGSIYAQTTDEYQFYVQGNDGIRLFIDDIQIFDEWYQGNHGGWINVFLAEGFHDLEMHYYSDNNGWAHLQMTQNSQTVAVQPVDPTPSISVTAWEGNTAPYLQGFTAGNPITAKVRSQVYGTWLTLDAATAAVVGDGNFGTGSYAVLSLDASTTDFPVIAISPASIDFGTLLLGSSSSQYVTVTNTGTAPLDVSLVTTSDSQFSISGLSSNVLSSGGVRPLLLPIRLQKQCRPMPS